MRGAARAGLALLALLAAGSCGPAIRPIARALSDADTGMVWFETAERVVISGLLAVPAGRGPFPAVMLLHGCSGLPSGTIEGWGPVLRGWGHATFVVDSFGGRGLSSVCRDALRLLGTERIADAYGALRLLVTHPRIDADRIALMGFSHGGIATLGSATEWARATYGTPAAGASRGARFRAFLPFYPYCNAEVPDMVFGPATPVRIHIGERDDWTPARTCVALAAAARAAGGDVETTVYPDARHSFDNVGLLTHTLWSADNAADCTPRLASLRGPILNLLELRRCMKKGATVGHSPEATEQARLRVRAQLADLLK